MGVPICHVEDGHKVATVCDLANMSLRFKRAIRWDPDKELAIGDKEAQTMCCGASILVVGNGGRRGIRTRDPGVANAVLSQLS